MVPIDARSRFLKTMQEGKKPFGVFVSCLDPAVTEVLADAGFDFVVLDAEHGKFGRVEVENHARAANQRGIVPFVRVLENSSALIQATLDAGAHGIVVPHVEDAAQARAAVAASRYSPRGRRGMCPACYAGAYELNRWSEHVAASDANVMIIPIIESRKSVENIEEIVAVDGIDVVHFGPGDLSADMGLDFMRDRKLLLASWQKVRDAARAAGKFSLVPRGWGFDEAEMLIAEMDFIIMLSAARKIVAEYKPPAS